MNNYLHLRYLSSMYLLSITYLPTTTPLSLYKNGDDNDNNNTKY